MTIEMIKSYGGFIYKGVDKLLLLYTSKARNLEMLYIAPPNRLVYSIDVFTSKSIGQLSQVSCTVELSLQMES